MSRTRLVLPMLDRSRPSGPGPADPRAVDMAYTYRRIIGGRVRDLRMAAGMTQSQLARHLDMGETAVSALELGRSSVSPERYEELADLFGLDRREWGAFLLRHTDPWLFALLFGQDIDPTLAEDLKALATTSRAPRTGPSRR